MDPSWKYKIVIKEPDWYNVQKWCEKNIGTFDQDWYKLGVDPAAYLFLKHNEVDTVWFFKQEKHAAMFALRWA